MSTSRRQFLKQTVGFSAALALGGRWTLAQGVDLRDRVEALVGGEAARHVMAVGDFGVKTKDLARQRAVSDAMVKYLKANQLTPDALALLGDNFYGGLSGKGVRSARWNENIEDMYPAVAFPGPMFAMLGNHDYGDERTGACVEAQLTYKGHNPATRWLMPAKWYRLNLPEENPLATILVIDTNRMPGKPGDHGGEPGKQLAWLEAELAKPRNAPWRFVMGHHPVYSDGAHGDTKGLVASLDPLFRRHHVDLYLCGHDHDLQHIEFDGHPTSFVISGGGGARARDLTGKDRSRFAKAIYGFTHLELRENAFTVRHVDANNNPLHAFTKDRAGKITVGPA